MNARRINTFFGHCTCGITNIEKLEKDAQAMTTYLHRKAEKKDWYFSIALVGSMYEPKLVKQVRLNNGNRGRPKKVFEVLNDDALKDPHLHFVINGIPGETIIEDMREYWQERHGKKKFFFEKVFYLKGCFNYMLRQGSFWRTKAHDPINILDIRLDKFAKEKDLFLHAKTRKHQIL